MGHTHKIDRSKSISSLKKTLFLVLALLVVELVFGWIAKSLALVSDALHLFTDAGAICLSLFAFWLSQKPATRRHTYGYYRMEIIAATVSGGSTIALAIFLIIEAVGRFRHPVEVHGLLVLIVASIGLVANFVMLRWLHASSEETLNVKGAYIHLLGDLLTSVGVVLSGLIITLTGWTPIDPIMTLVLSVLILWSAIKLIRETVSILMEAAPKHIDVGQIEKDLLAIPSIDEVHDLHVWSLTEGQVNLSAHVTTKEASKALQEATRVLQEKHHIHHTTIQLEAPDMECPAPCVHKKSR